MGFDEPIFRKTADEVIDLLLAQPSPWRDPGFAARLADGHAVELDLPRGSALADAVRSDRAAEPTRSPSRSRATSPRTRTRAATRSAS